MDSNTADSNSSLEIFKEKSLNEVLEKNQQLEQASEFYKYLIHYIEEFDRSLDQEHEVGIRMVNFGQAVQFSVHDIGYYNPKLICFYGETEDGSRIQLVQHVNQINFLLLSVKRKNAEQPKHLIGFSRKLSNQPEQNSTYDPLEQKNK